MSFAGQWKVKAFQKKLNTVFLNNNIHCYLKFFNFFEFCSEFVFPSNLLGYCESTMKKLDWQSEYIQTFLYNIPMQFLYC